MQLKVLFYIYLLIFLEKEYRETSTCCSTYFCIHWLILLHALTRHQTATLAYGGRLLQQLRQGKIFFFFMFLFMLLLWLLEKFMLPMRNCYFKSMLPDGHLRGHPPPKKNPTEFIYKNLCIYSYMFKLQSPSRDSLFDAIHLLRPLPPTAQKQFLNFQILMPFKCFCRFLFHLFNMSKNISL